MPDTSRTSADADLWVAERNGSSAKFYTLLSKVTHARALEGLLLTVTPPSFYS